MPDDSTGRDIVSALQKCTSNTASHSQACGMFLIC
jgi:hypothetical protein